MNNVNNSILEGKKHIHMMGIGGSGMYPLAQMLHAKGYFVTGSDNNETDTLKAVRSMGIKVCPLGQRAENIEGADLIVYTAAILPDNPEYVAAVNSGVPMLERAELLGIVTGWFSEAVCVTGTHGKTTVTSMITTIMKLSGRDISAYIGGKLPLIGGSGCIGTEDTIVCEACEFKDHYLHLHPTIAVINNIDEDHLDYFGDLSHIIDSFVRFGSMANTVIANVEDENTKAAAERINKPLITFGYGSGNDYYPDCIRTENGLRTTFTVYRRGEKFGDFVLNVPGRHNVLNALAAAAAADLCGVPAEDIAAGIEAFHGAKRRFDKYGEVNDITVCDDYGHHPTELRITLEAAVKRGFNRVWAVFQPFTFSRTALLLDDFASALSIADKCVITAIMGGREKNTYNIFDRDLGEKVKGSVYFPEEQDHDRNFELTASYVAENAERGDLIVTMGCGDVNKCANLILDKLREKYHE